MIDQPMALMLDDLLPGGEGFPSASGVALWDWLQGHPEWAEAARAVLATLPADFAEAPPAAREGLLRAAEASDPTLFGRMLVGVYAGYYISPSVRTVIEARTGYPARPPQPQGYALPAFDASLLDEMRRRPPSYRPG